MKGILVYQPPDKPAQLPEFIDGLDPRLREKSFISCPSPISRSCENPISSDFLWNAIGICVSCG